MAVLLLILFALGAACFLAGALNVAARFNPVAAGLFFWILVPLIQTLDSLT